MQELAQSTFYYEQFPEVMGMLWKRMLQDNRAAWRRTYKSLLLLNYLVRNGSERVVTSAREHIYDLRTLENFKYMDEHGKDQGLNIRYGIYLKAKCMLSHILTSILCLDGHSSINVHSCFLSTFSTKQGTEQEST